MARRHALQRGFTLIEILVVIVIMMVVVGTTVARLESSDRRKIRQTAERLGFLLETARDEAVATGSSVAISSDGQGYQFWSADEGRNEWLPLPTNEVLVSKRLPDDVTWGNQMVNGRQRPIGERIVFSPNGLVEPFTIELRSGDASVLIVSDVMGRVELGDVPSN